MEKLQLEGTGRNVHIKGDLFEAVLAVWEEGGHTLEELGEMAHICTAVAMQVDYEVGGALSAMGTIVQGWPSSISKLMMLPHMIRVLTIEGAAQSLVKLLDELVAHLEKTFANPPPMSIEDILNEKR